MTDSQPGTADSQPGTTLTLAVVGHTNTGKTSLLRTLLRNRRFGEVRNSAGTTRHVEAARLRLTGAHSLELRDTPGLEDSIALGAELQTLQANGLRGRACLEHFVLRAGVEFEQETKVLKQALACDALLYVIDCRDEVLEKYRQEIQSLALAARPILPVLNFIGEEKSQPQAWRSALAELGLHALVEFDTVAFDFAAEQRLYQKLQTLLETWYQPLQTLLDTRAQEWRQMHGACVAEVARLLVETVTLTVPERPGSEPVADLQNRVRAREQQCLRAVLDLLRFDPADVQLARLPVQNGEWQMDLFDPATLKTFGIDAASAAATGAAIGAGVDLLLAGISLGAASLTGAALGAAWHTGRRYGRDFWARLKGEKTLCVDEITLNLVLLRQLNLLRQLFRRGHAAQDPLQVTQGEQKVLPAGWSERLRQMRALMVLKAGPESREYQRALDETERWLAEIL